MQYILSCLNVISRIKILLFFGVGGCPGDDKRKKKTLKNNQTKMYNNRWMIDFRSGIMSLQNPSTTSPHSES